MPALDREQIANWLELLGLPAPQDGENDEALRQRVAKAFQATAADVLEGDGSDARQATARINRRRLEKVVALLDSVEVPGYGVVDAEVAGVKQAVNLMLQGMGSV